MAKLSKKRIVWAINETKSMHQAAKLLNVAYNTFKKYAKLYEVFQPIESLKGIFRGTRGSKQPELSNILAGNQPNYSTAKLQYRLCREGFLAEECSNCGYEEYRTHDMTKPLMLDYLDDDSTNKDIANLRLLCYNCYYLLKLDRVGPEIPASVKSFQKAVYNAFKHQSE